MLALIEMLHHAPRYGLKYIFVHDSYYEPLLTFAGWRQIDSFNFGETTVWSTIGIPPATQIPSPLRPPRWQGIMWGTVPFGCSLVTIVLAFVFRKKNGAPEDDESDELAGQSFEVQKIASEETDTPELASPQHGAESPSRSDV
jgi:hypothetical protein